MPDHVGPMTLFRSCRGSIADGNDSHRHRQVRWLFGRLAIALQGPLSRANSSVPPVRVEIEYR